MKKLLFLFILMLSTMLASADSFYHPLLKDNKEWTMAYLGAVPPEYQHTFSYEQIKLGSALEVNGMTFKQIVSLSWWYNQDGPSNWKETDEYLGEADGKVYLYNQKSLNTVQIMDFTLQVGDTYRQMQMGDPNDYMDFVVMAVTDTVIATSSDKTPRKCLYLSRPGTTNINDVWIEGIGSLVGGVRGGYEQLMAGAIPTLRSCQQDGQTLYEAYHPFLKQGKRWNCQGYYSNVWTGEQWTKDVSYVINGTTSIGGKTYYVMYRGTEEGFEYYCTLREEGRKVWIKPPYDSERLLYDFGMSVGESYIPNEYEYNYQLTDIKTMRFQYDQLLNVLYYDISEYYDVAAPANHIATAPIVEGVGCEIGWNITKLYEPQPTNGIINNEKLLSCYEGEKCVFTAGDFNKLTNPESDIPYHPFVEDSKVWKTGSTTGISDGIVKMVEYYYFDGDTIIDGKTCKQMMCQRYVNPNHPDYAVIMQYPLLRHAGVWYEEDKKVYLYDTTNKQFQMMYDFSLEANETLQIHEYDLYVVGPRQTGGLEGFKGVYRDVMFYADEDPYYCTTWLEGVGGIDGPTRNVYYGKENHPEFLMSCTVGDEVIYLNDEYEDGASPEGMEAAKKRFDFTHTTKLKPKAPEVKAPRRSETEQSLYGEYNDLQLGINLDPLDDAYQVTITNESGKVVYEKAINAGTIVGLSIDISDYAKGRYTVTVENSLELFVGEFEAQTTGIVEVRNKKEEASGHIYNLQGLRVNSLQKGLNIVNGQKVYVK